MFVRCIAYGACEPSILDRKPSKRDAFGNRVSLQLVTFLDSLETIDLLRFFSGSCINQKSGIEGQDQFQTRVVGTGARGERGVLALRWDPLPFSEHAPQENLRQRVAKTVFQTTQDTGARSKTTQKSKGRLCPLGRDPGHVADDRPLFCGNRLHGKP